MRVSWRWAAVAVELVTHPNGGTSTKDIFILISRETMAPTMSPG
jgi:hypothetical protein